MKVGDLVKMKYEMWWRSNPENPHRAYTDQPGIVYDLAGKGVKVLMPDGTIKVSLIDYWDLI